MEGSGGAGGGKTMSDGRAGDAKTEFGMDGPEGLVGKAGDELMSGGVHGGGHGEGRRKKEEAEWQAVRKEWRGCGALVLHMLLYNISAAR